MFKTIVVPLDGSRFSSIALKYAIDIADHYKAQLILVRAVERTVPIATAGASIGVETAASSRLAVEAAEREDRIHERQAKQYMRKKVREVASEGVKAEYHVVFGDPYKSIMDICKQEKADLVVMTTHGKSGLKRAILGSVADKIVRDARVPVLVIRPKRRR
jgi:nucleotide-binding universal stress UspA family protein